MPDAAAAADPAPDAPDAPLSLSRTRHALHCSRCLTALPGTQVELDSSRAALVFYCLGALDLLGAVEKSAPETRAGWRGALWALQSHGAHGGFRPSTYMTPARAPGAPETPAPGDPPHLIMTYTALLALAILRDDFSALDRPGVLRLLRACQRPDGSFATTPGSEDADLRLSYCALVLCALLRDWSAVDLPRAIAYIHACRTYEGGYGQEPGCEAIGGTTYCALAALTLAAQAPAPPPRTTLPRAARAATVRWLAHHQRADSGGFAGRTGKPADACYAFWCAAALAILGAEGGVHASANAQFLDACQFTFGGIAKAPDESPDPYHTYMALAALAVVPAPAPAPAGMFDASWALPRLDPLLNARAETAAWARAHVPEPARRVGGGA